MNLESKKDLERWAGGIEERVDALSKADWNKRFEDYKGTGPSEEFLEGAGEWVKNVIKQSHPRTGVRSAVKVNERFLEKWSEKAKLGTPLYSDAVTGSYTVPQGFYQEVARVAELESVCMNKVTKVPMGTQQVVFPSESVGLSVEWENAQTSSKSEISPTFGQVTLNSKTVGGYTGVSMGELEDNGVNIASHFFKAWGEAYGQEVDRQVLYASSDPFTGVLQNGSAQIHQMGDGQTTQDDMTASDVDSMIAQLTAAKYRKGAELFMNTLTYDVLRTLKDGMGQYIIAPWAADPWIWRGYKCNLSDQISTPGANTPFVGFFNPRHVFMGVRKDLELQVYDKTSYAATEDQIFLVARSRLAFAYPLTSAYAVMKTASA